MKKLIGLLTGAFVLSLFLSACGQIVKTNLRSLNENPERSKGKGVIVTTDIKSIVEKEEAYIGNKIELAGYIKEKKFSDFKDWGFVLNDKSGTTITCYEFETRDVNFIVHEIALRQAKKGNVLVTVIGELRKGPRIELETF